MPQIPRYVGHQSAIWADAVEARKDGHHELRHSEERHGNQDNGGHSLIDREKEYHQADVE